LVLQTDQSKWGSSLDDYSRRIGGGSLKAPTITQMDRRNSETISSEIDVDLSFRQKGTKHKVFEDSGHYAGLEVVGDLDN
jgi:hypothetical protein